MADAERIEHLEQAVERLHHEVAALRSEVQRVTGRPVSAAAPVPAGAATAAPAEVPTPPAGSQRARALVADPVAPRMPAVGTRGGGRYAPVARQLDLEALVGRYGTIALATLTIVVGAGAFLTWAIANGKLGPFARLAIGAVVAVVVAVFGMRLRGRGAPRYGNALLGLALALAHVEAWGAGPSLEIVSSGVALAIAAVASLALAAMALRVAEESLFAVGLGGALLAPFVVSEGDGHLFLLLAYGLVVIGIGIYAMRRRAWSVASGLLVLACLGYAAAGVAIAASLPGWRHGVAPALFAMGCAWAAMLWGGERRRGFALGCLGIALVAFLAGIGLGRVPLAIAAGLPLAATLTGYLVSRVPGLTTAARRAAVIVLPLGFFGAALALALRDAGTQRGELLAALWTVLAVGAAWNADGGTRALHVMVAGLVSAAGVLLALHARPALLVPALAAHAVVFAALLSRVRHAAVMVPVVAVLATAIGVGFVQLAERPAFGYTPFLTPPSAAALCLALGCWLVWLQVRGAAPHGGASWGIDVTGVAGTVAALVTFFWGREELRHAFAPDVAIFLLVLYFALAGVVTIFIGRRRGIPLARFAGLALALYAALKAVLRAWDYGAVGLKVASCALAGAFLFAVAYWYRGTGGADDATRE